MPAVETLQQANMFTGQWETKRTRNVLHQMSMFPVNETFEFGARIRPYLAEAPAPVLELISEDPRTPEQVEQDLIREAEALTTSLFPDVLEQKGLDNENDHQPPQKPVEDGEITKFSAYRALVTLVREQAETLWVDSAYRQRYYNQLPLTIQAAQDAGLTATEISAAMQIGEFLGTRECESAELTSRVMDDASRGDETPPAQAANVEPASPTPSLSPQSAIRAGAAREGLRARLRHEHIPVRTRRPNATAPDSVPLEWMEREHIQKRLPYLAEGIAQLDEDELASMAESISQVLQETYWTILAITLSHHLDHEQQGEQTERGERTA